ncbi:cutinase family protein [Candidatus Saccharibacteria bacterium]|nr:cutinase family protein [Candidatus Saccharibacteria bacterium]
MIKKILSILTIAGMLTVGLPARTLAAETGCADVEFVFIRGSGETKDYGESYQAFKDSMTEKMSALSLSYNFQDLDYPAVSVAEIGTLVGAFFSGGESGTFGDSVNAGVNELKRVINTTCPNSKFVLAGYSQGAMVISKTLNELNANKIIYAATFGDPKIFLPEGETSLFNMVPAACYNRNLSDYRRYVPDCFAYEGILGSYRPYEPEAFIGKLGTWCNSKDLMCSNFYGSNIRDHVSYVADGLYEDASRYIFDKITTAFGIENNYYSPHDTVILIDSTGSMQPFIERYKERAIEFANQTFDKGGRVALYDYRDLKEAYAPRQHCDFDTCTPEVFVDELNQIVADGGGDEPESLLSAAFHTMSELEWQQGATKSLIVLTDAGYHLPDIDAVDLDDVVALSRRIDPVNIYVVTEPTISSHYLELAEQTGGRVILSTEEFELVTNEINARFDSLPQVDTTTPTPFKPTLTVTDSWKDESSFIHVTFNADTPETVVILNDAIMGDVTGNEVVIGDLEENSEYILKLVPIANGNRGDTVEINLNTIGGRGGVEIDEPIEEPVETPIKTPQIETRAASEPFIPLAPDTGGKWRH